MSKVQDELAEQVAIFASYLRENGLRMTRQRETIVRTFLSSEGHLSTEELYDLVKRVDSRIGYATVFRTLKALTECGLARETDLADGRARFEHYYRHPQHHHIICVQCNRTIEFFSPELESLHKKIVAQYDFEALRTRFQIFGICAGCRNKADDSGPPVDADLVFARDALRIALETERRGVHFYTTASEISARRPTKETFHRMLRDEESHLNRLTEAWNHLVEREPRVLDAPVFLHFDFEALKTIFPSREQISRRLRPEMTEEEAFRLAMAMEKEAAEFFIEYADRFSDTHGRDIFLQFAAEEEEHYKTIRSALEDHLARAAADDAEEGSAPRRPPNPDVFG